jgi:hypothetical protein
VKLNKYIIIAVVAFAAIFAAELAGIGPSKLAAQVKG